jgi:hypothetical protein
MGDPGGYLIHQRGAGLGNYGRQREIYVYKGPFLYRLDDHDRCGAMKTIVTILLSGISLLAFGQSGPDQGSGISRQQLIGVWQEGSATVGDALKKNFQFFTDGHFVLNFSQYDDIATVRALGGKYKLDSSGLMGESRAVDDTGRICV